MKQILDNTGFKKIDNLQIIAMESNGRLWFIRTCVVCAVTSLFMFLCCVYCTVLIHRITEIHENCKSRTVSSKVVEQVLTGTEIKGFPKDDSRPAPYTINERRYVRSADKKSSKKEKKPRKKKGKLKAAHYQSMVSDPFIQAAFPSYQDGNLTKTCLLIEEMAGTLCRTKDYVTNNSKNSIQAFTPAPWVIDKMAPFTVNDKGFFKARYTGVHLIYAQVLFYDNKEAQILRLVQLRGSNKGEMEIQSLTCHESVDKRGPVTYHSCGIIGLFSLKKKDVVYLQNVFGDVKLNLRPSTTYIGALLLK